MPRRSPYKILLDDKEERQLEALARKYTSPYCDVMRAKVVLLAAQGFSNKRDRPTLTVAAPDRVEVAQTLLRGTPGRPSGTAKARATPRFFPLRLWWKSRRSPVSCQKTWECPSRTLLAMKSRGRPCSVALLLLSAARRCGAGSTPMRFVPGVIAAGSGPETQISSGKLGEFLICIIEPGWVSDWGLPTM